MSHFWRAGAARLPRRLDAEQLLGLIAVLRVFALVSFLALVRVNCLSSRVARERASARVGGFGVPLDMMPRVTVYFENFETFPFQVARGVKGPARRLRCPQASPNARVQGIERPTVERFLPQRSSSDFRLDPLATSPRRKSGCGCAPWS